MANAVSTASSSTCKWLMLCVWLDEALGSLGLPWPARLIVQ